MCCITYTDNISLYIVILQNLLDYASDHLIIKPSSDTSFMRYINHTLISFTCVQAHYTFLGPRTHNLYCTYHHPSPTFFIYTNQHTLHMHAYNHNLAYSLIISVHSLVSLWENLCSIFMEYFYQLSYIVYFHSSTHTRNSEIFKGSLENIVRIK